MLMTHDSISYLRMLCRSVLLLSSDIESARNAAAHRSELKKKLSIRVCIQL